LRELESLITALGGIDALVFSEGIHCHRSPRRPGLGRYLLIVRGPG
jgi:hypothetical protein